MSLPNRLEIQRLCSEIEALVGDQDINMGHGKKAHISVLGGKYAQAEKEKGSGKGSGVD